MKIQISLYLFILVFIQASGQSPKSLYEQIGLTTDKTSSMVFPSMIRYVDRGSSEILTEPVGEAPNILLIKARRTSFRPTSLNVITADGRIYCFLLQYDSVPLRLVHYISPQDANSDPHPFTDTQIKFLTEQLQVHNRVGRTRTVHSWGMSARLVGIFAKQNLLFISLQLRNTSSLPYEVEAVRFYVKEPVTSKRTARQEKEINPIYLTTQPLLVEGNSERHIAAAFHSFTLPAGKKLYINIREKAGGRNLQLRLTNRDLVHATLVP